MITVEDVTLSDLFIEDPINQFIITYFENIFKVRL